MNKKILLVPLLAASLLLPACQSEDRSKDVAIANFSTLLHESEPGKAAKAFLETLEKDFTAKLATAQQKAQADPENAEAAQQFQSIYMNLQQRIQTEEQNVSNTLVETVTKAIKDFRANNGYKVIIYAETVIDYDKSLDITPQLLDSVNKLNIDFKPVTSDPVTPATEPADANSSEAAPADEAAPSDDAAPAEEEAPAEPAAPEAEATEAAPAAPEAPQAETSPADAPKAEAAANAAPQAEAAPSNAVK